MQRRRSSCLAHILDDVSYPDCRTTFITSRVSKPVVQILARFIYVTAAFSSEYVSHKPSGALSHWWGPPLRPTQPLKPTLCLWRWNRLLLGRSSKNHKEWHFPATNPLSSVDYNKPTTTPAASQLASYISPLLLTPKRLWTSEQGDKEWDWDQDRDVEQVVGRAKDKGAESSWKEAEGRDRQKTEQMRL